MPTYSRLMLVTPEGRLVEPRRYAQSTSGLTPSHRTLPSLSRSSDMTSDSPSCCPTEIALRRYPTVVPQRSAYASCSSRPNEFRYERSSSIGELLPMGNTTSIPTAHLPFGNGSYAHAMDVYETRRRRLGQLVSEYGNQSELAKRIDRPANYISRMLSRGKNRKRIGEDIARDIEQRLGKPAYWLDQQEGATPAKHEDAWPFRAVSRVVWETLSPAERRQAEQHLLTIVMGIEAQRQSKKGAG